MKRVWSAFLPAAAVFFLAGVSGSVASADATRPDPPGNEIRFPVFQGTGVTSKTGKASSPPEIPFSIADEVPGRSPGAVSGSWITIFEIDLTPIGTGKLDDAEASPEEPAPPDETKTF